MADDALARLGRLAKEIRDGQWVPLYIFYGDGDTPVQEAERDLAETIALVGQQAETIRQLSGERDVVKDRLKSLQAQAGEISATRDGLSGELASERAAHRVTAEQLSDALAETKAALASERAAHVETAAELQQHKDTLATVVPSVMALTTERAGLIAAGFPEENGKGCLARAAACYAAYATRKPGDQRWNAPGFCPPGWPWSAAHWTPLEPRDALTKAGAMIALELERT